MNPIHAIHVLDNRECGRTDLFHVLPVRAFHQAGQPVTAINRPNSPLTRTLEMIDAGADGNARLHQHHGHAKTVKSHPALCRGLL